MNGNALHVHQVQAVRDQQPGERRHGVIEEVLVVDGVELDPIYEVAHVGRLDDSLAVVTERAHDSLHHRPDVGKWASTLLACSTTRYWLSERRKRRRHRRDAPTGVSSAALSLAVSGTP